MVVIHCFQIHNNRLIYLFSLVFQSKNNFCISPITHPSTSKLPFLTVFDRNFYLSKQGSNIFVYIYLVCRQSLFVYILLGLYVILCLWLVLFVFLINFVCNNGLIYFSALVFQSKFLYLPKKSPFFNKFFLLSFIKFIKKFICQLVSHFVCFPTNLLCFWMN